LLFTHVSPADAVELAPSTPPINIAPTARVFIALLRIFDSLGHYPC
jgi:hypothetical protein